MTSIISANAPEVERKLLSETLTVKPRFSTYRRILGLILCVGLCLLDWGLFGHQAELVAGGSVMRRPCNDHQFPHAAIFTQCRGRSLAQAPSGIEPVIFDFEQPLIVAVPTLVVESLVITDVQGAPSVPRDYMRNKDPPADTGSVFGSSFSS